jgi:hypothetical protein
LVQLFSIPSLHIENTVCTFRSCENKLWPADLSATISARHESRLGNWEFPWILNLGEIEGNYMARGHVEYYGRHFDARRTKETHGDMGVMRANVVSLTMPAGRIHALRFYS